MSTISEKTRNGTRQTHDGRRAGAAAAQPGDWIEVEGTRGAGPRRGVIEEVLGTGAHVRLLVRWDEKHASLLYPSAGGYVVHAKQRS